LPLELADRLADEISVPFSLKNCFRCTFRKMAVTLPESIESR
jgi:hypothetical protein